MHNILKQWWLSTHAYKACKDSTTHTARRENPSPDCNPLSPSVYIFLLCRCRSIRENILNGERGATNEDIIAAAKAAHIHDFIMTLNKGYDEQACRIYTHAFESICRQIYLHTRLTFGARLSNT